MRANKHGHRFQAAALRRGLLGAAFATVVLPLCAAAQDQGYRISAGDVLQITVYGDANLSGDYAVGTDGTIAYPLLGSVSIAGQSPAEIARTLDSALLEHVQGISVAVSVKQYAPVFIIGDVKTSGRFDYRPGMIALELFALGGGLREPNDPVDTAGTQLVAARAEYADTMLELFAGEVRKARLEAELNDKMFEYAVPATTPPEEVAERQKVIDTEKQVFELRLQALLREEASLQTQRQNYNEEVKTLEESAKLRDGELDLLQESLAATMKLVERGLTSQATLREAQRQMSSMRRDVLEFGSYLARAKQNENAILQKLETLRDQRRNDAAQELRDLAIRVPKLQKQQAYILQRMAEISAAAQRVETREQALKITFTVVRIRNGQYSETAISEHDPIMTGDILKVGLVSVDQRTATNLN